VRVGIVVQPLERTPPIRSGAVERTVWYLAESLVSLGHQVTLFASGDSQTTARLVPAVERSILHDLDYAGQEWWPQTIQAAQVVRMQSEFDVINSHAGYSLLSAVHALRVPFVTSWHGFMHRPITRAILSNYSYAPLIATSDYQRKASEDLSLNWIAMVHNGIAESDLSYGRSGQDYLLFMARLVPDKRPDVAIRVALAAGMPLKLAGKIFDATYFDEAIRPFLRLPSIEYVGEVIGNEKKELLANARALLHPSEFEACSNVIIEAMGSGTPVICLDRSSNNELVADGVTGFVCDSLNEMRDSCGRLDSLDRGACRSRYLSKFTVDHMVAGYLAAFGSLCS
jgi:glycosyltransferase involved in cell wall biosynthesis